MVGTDDKARYSILFAGQKLNIDAIKEYLENGIKVLWFGSHEDKKILDKTFPAFKNEYLLNTFISIDNNTKIILVDGKEITTYWEELEALENADEEFNLQQYKIEHQPPNKILEIEAGAGSGKTHVMIDRLMFLMHVCDDFDFSKVAMITFTNEATDNMRHRLISTLNKRYFLTKKIEYLEQIESLSEISISTIHSFFKTVIKEIGPLLGYGNGIELRSYTKEKKELVLDIIDRKFGDKNANVSNSVGLAVQAFIKLAMLYWDKLNNNGMAENQVRKLEWGNVENGRPHSIQKSLIDVFSEADDLYNEKKFHDNAISMQDIIHELGRVIYNPKLDDYLVHRYEYIFCDEFQDSDNVQIATIAMLNRLYKGNLFVVGDIKQSIYRFRGASDSAFALLESLLSEDEKSRLVKESLVKNYRTSKDILDKLDVLFLAWAKESQKLLTYNTDKSEGLVDRLKAQVDECGAFEICSVGKNTRQSIFMHKLQRVMREYPGKRYVCLTRRNEELKTLKEWCEQEKIPCLIKEKGAFYTSRAVLDFCALVEALQFDSEPMYLFNYMNSSYNDREFDINNLVLCNGDKMRLLHEIGELIDLSEWNKIKQDIHDKPVMAVLREIIAQKDPVFIYGKQRVRQLIKQGFSDGEASIQTRLDVLQYNADLKKILRIVTESFAGDFCTLADICEFIRLKILTDRTEEKAEIKDKELSGYVEGYTVHGSKGLEFDYVFMPFMENPFVNSFRSEILISEDHSKVGWFYKENEIEFKNANYDILKGDEDIEVAREETRLLYVAMTRAKYGLFCFIADGDKKGNQINKWSDLLSISKG